MTEKIPQISIINAIRPDQAHVASPRLRYPGLELAVKKHTVYDGQRWDDYIEATDELQELKAADELARQYFLQTSLKLNEAGSSLDIAKWSNRLTQASVELFGQPEVEIARNLLLQQNEEFISLRDNPNISSQLLEYLISLYGKFNLGTKSGEERETQEAKIDVAANVIGSVLDKRYGDILQVFDSDGKSEEYLYPPQVVELFAEALEKLKTVSKDWVGWEVKLAESANFSRLKETIKIGRNRTPIRRSELPGIFGHEVLIHGLRRVNGQKINNQLKLGLPGYLGAEEGIALLAETSLNGRMPPKPIDRYVDTSLALGQITDHPLTRKELFLLASTRNIIRMQAERTETGVSADPAGINRQKAAQIAQKEALQHVNRIYRGSSGDNNVAVMTNDIIYFEGINPLADYIAGKLESGRTADEIFDYLMFGKFDPNNKLHIKFIESVVA